jgi:hypothetical protein
MTWSEARITCCWCPAKHESVPRLTVYVCPGCGRYIQWSKLAPFQHDGFVVSTSMPVEGATCPRLLTDEENAAIDQFVPVVHSVPVVLDKPPARPARDAAAVQNVWGALFGTGEVQLASEAAQKTSVAQHPARRREPDVETVPWGRTEDALPAGGTQLDRVLHDDRSDLPVDLAVRGSDLPELPQCDREGRTDSAGPQEDTLTLPAIAPNAICVSCFGIAADHPTERISDQRVVTLCNAKRLRLS